MTVDALMTADDPRAPHIDDEAATIMAMACEESSRCSQGGGCAGAGQAARCGADQDAGCGANAIRGSGPCHGPTKDIVPN